jgi:2-hydroxychromene-2-carboxylate isomerase
MSEITCWFDFASNYSYLSVLRLARQHDVIVHWKPFLLGPIFKDRAGTTRRSCCKDKGDYVERHAARVRQYGLPWRQPSAFPRRSILAARVALLVSTNRGWPNSAPA